MLPFLESLATRKEHLRRLLSHFSERVESISRLRRPKCLFRCELIDDRLAKVDATMEEDDGFLMQSMNPLYEKLIRITGMQLPWASLMAQPLTECRVDRRKYGQATEANY